MNARYGPAAAGPHRQRKRKDMTIHVNTPSKARSRGTAGESGAPAHRAGPSTDETATVAGTTNFEEFAAALRAWADEIIAIRVALNAAHLETPTDPRRLQGGMTMTISHP